MSPQVDWHDLIVPEPNSGCWLWDGRYGNNGYGTYGGGRSGERIAAHRLVWAKVKGPIPVGLMVLHRCDVRGCVNPDHLFLGTAKDNTQDMMAKGRFVMTDRHSSRQNARKTHCKHGHPFIEGRVSFNKKGGRVCLECYRLREREKRARKRAAS